MHRCAAQLGDAGENAEMALQLFLTAAYSASEHAKSELIAYEFFEQVPFTAISVQSAALQIGHTLLPCQSRMFVNRAIYVGAESHSLAIVLQAFLLFEESIPDSAAERTALASIVGALHGCRIFSAESRSTLVHKATGYSAKLLRKGDQCRAVLACSHLHWQARLLTQCTDLRVCLRAVTCCMKSLVHLSIRQLPTSIHVNSSCSYMRVVPPSVERPSCQLLLQDGIDDEETAESREKAPQKAAADNGDSAASHDDADNNGSSNVWQPPVSHLHPQPAKSCHELHLISGIHRQAQPISKCMYLSFVYRYVTGTR